VSELAAHETEYGVVEQEPPELLGRNLSSAGHLLASSTAFFFLAFVFAYFYLRSLNNAHLWRPKHVDPSQTLGVIVMGLVLGAAILLRLAREDQRAGRRPQWRLKGALTLGVVLLAIVLQVVEWFVIGFGPSSGGYASVFFGWTAAQIVCMLGGAYWLETLLATAIRYRKTPQAEPAAGEASGDPYRPAHDIRDVLGLVSPGLEAVTFYWSFLAGTTVIAWIVLYLL
jgi:heme/copper-type cytochrome/quinol oxidase subunit 3